LRRFFAGGRGILSAKRILRELTSSDALSQCIQGKVAPMQLLWQADIASFLAENSEAIPLDGSI
jgi:hypothetical protein